MAIALAIGSFNFKLMLALLVAQGFSMLILSLYTSRGPTLDPRVELRLERYAAAKKAGTAVACSMVLGSLTLLAPYLKTWVIAVGAFLLGVVGLQAGRQSWERLAGSLAGLACGAVFATAALIGSSHQGAKSFVLAGIIVGAPVFVFALIGNFVSHVADGDGRQGAFVAPFVATIYGFPIGLFGGSVIAVTVLAHRWWSLGFAGGVAGLVVYAIALAVGFLVMTRWVVIWLGRSYYALAGIFPLRLLTFLEDFCEAGVLRRVGYSYEFKHAAILRVYRSSGGSVPDEGETMW